MSDIVRGIILLAFAGAAVTAFVWAWLRWMDEARRIGRALTRVLGGPPESVLVAHGAGRGAGFSFDAAQIAVAWDAGKWCLVYGLDELVGAELCIDHEVAARTHRGEPRRALDRRAPDARAVSLRLIFDDPRHPDFELALWPPPPGRRASGGASDAIAEGARWLARVEAILRRYPIGSAAVVRADPAPAPRQAEPPPWEDEAFDDEEERPI